MTIYQRWQHQAIHHALKTRRVVMLGGARQCGKTTLLKTFRTAETTYRTLDDKLLLQAAQLDPHEFVKHLHALMIIDEVQKAIDLLPAIKMVVDDNNQPGQYLLTGSANIQLLPSVTESLAGRIRTIPLRPLAQGEVNHHQPNFIPLAFTESFEPAKSSLARDEIIEIALRGGYPEPLRFTAQERQLWHQDYLDTLLERDLRHIMHIRRQDALHQLLQVVCAWSTKPIDIAAIGSGLSLQRSTVESYLNAIETLYLIDRIKPYAKTDYDRVGKQAKLIVNDSGLMASVLRLRIDDIRFDSDRVGKLIETHVGNELQKHLDTTKNQYSLYHYRDKNKREIDFLIEAPQGDLLGIEVKTSTSPGFNDFKHLKWFKDNLKPPQKKFVGIVLYTGNIIASFGESLWAVPISCLY